jgi:hypothetical protein
MRGLESFLPRVVDTTVVTLLSTSHRSASVSRRSCCRGRRAERRLEIDPEAEFVLEFDEAAELVELLCLLFATEGGEHPGKIAF